MSAPIIVGVPIELVMDPSVSALGVRVWAALALFEGQTQLPRFHDIAQVVGTHERTVENHLRELRAAGWVSWRRAGSRNRYTLIRVRGEG